MEQTISVTNPIKAWLWLFRPPFHTVGVFPLLLGMVIPWSQGYSIDWGVLILATLAVILIMLTTYVGGEYYDYETDSTNVSFNKFSGGTRVLQTGVIPRWQALVAANIFLLLAVVIGLILYLYYDTGRYTLPLGAFGLLCGYFYTVRPLQWSYRGIGEVLIGICYGWLTVNTGYYLQTGDFSLVETLVSIPIAFSIFLVILINEFPDYESDKAAGKRNLVVRFGRERMAALYIVLLLACYIALVVGIGWGVPWVAAPLSILLLPLIIGNIIAVKGAGFRNAKVLEGVCARTILVNLLTASIYILAFAIEKWV